MDYFDCNRCLFHPPSTIVDMVHPKTGRSAINGESLEQIRKRYPGAVEMDLDEAIALKASAFRQPPSEVTAEHYQEMLEVLPPEGWKSTAKGQSFKMAERTSGAITSIYCALPDGRYFYLADDFTLPHEEIVKRCEALAIDTPHPGGAEREGEA